MVSLIPRRAGSGHSDAPAGGYLYAPFLFINDRHEITGIFVDQTGHSHGIFISATGITSLVDYPGADESGLLGADNQGKMVGEFLTGGQQPRLRERKNRSAEIK